MAFSLGSIFQQGRVSPPRAAKPFFDGLNPSDDFSITGGAISQIDENGLLRPSYINQYTIGGGRWAKTVAEGAKLGPELITNAANREFTSDTGFWTKTGNASISGGVCLLSSTANQGILAGFLVIGKRYFVSYEILSAESNGVLVKVGATAAAANTELGVKTEELVCSTDTLLRFYSTNTATSPVIDNISVREVIPQWITTDIYGNDLQPAKIIRTAKGLLKEHYEVFADDIDDASEYAIGDQVLVQTVYGPMWLECIGISEDSEYFAQFNCFDCSDIFSITGGPIATRDMNNILQPGHADVPSTMGMRYATTVEEGAVLGPELAFNGTFDTGDGWTSITGAVIENGKLQTNDATSGAAYYESLLTVGKRYQVTFDIANWGEVAAGVSGQTLIGGYAYQEGTNVVEGVALQTYLRIAFSAVTPGCSFDNISVREVIPQWVPEVGPELVTDGGFDGDGSDWTFSDYSALGDGVVIVTDSPTSTDVIQQDLPTEIGKTYLLSFRLQEITEGTIGIYVVGVNAAEYKASVGTYSRLFVATAETHNIRVRTSNVSSSGSIDNISVREVYPGYAPHLTDSEGNPDYTTTDSTKMFDYDSVRGKELYNNNELRYFDARTNLCLQSEGVGFSLWAKDGLTVTADAAVAPDGTITADRITPTNYEKIFAIYDLTNTAWIAQDIAYADYGGINTDKYNRIIYTFTTPADCVSVAVYTNRCNTGASWQRQVMTVTPETTYTWSFYIKDGETYFDVWGAQLEVGSEATWYIPTEATTVTKPAGVYSRVNPLFVPGTLFEESRTNKCTCRKANPTDTSNITKSGDAAATLTVVDDTAALTAAGLDKICTSGKVYKLDNSAGTGNAFAVIAGVTGNTNKHSYSVYARKTVGDGSLVDSAVGWSVAIPSSVYTKVVQENQTPPTTTNLLAIKAEATAVVYFILPQLEEGAFCTSEIFRDSDYEDPLTSITRPATLCSADSAGILRGNDFGIMGQVNPEASGQGDSTTVTYFSTLVDNSNYTSVYTAGGDNIVLLKRINAVNEGLATTGLTTPPDVPFQYQAYQSSTYGMGIRIRYWLGLVWSAWSAWATNADTQDAPIASTFELMSRNNANRFNGHLKHTYIIQHMDPKARLEQLTEEGVLC
jgi:hypothetical protein